MFANRGTNSSKRGHLQQIIICPLVRGQLTFRLKRTAADGDRAAAAPVRRRAICIMHDTHLPTVCERQMKRVQLKMFKTSNETRAMSLKTAPGSQMSTAAGYFRAAETQIFAKLWYI